MASATKQNGFLVYQSKRKRKMAQFKFIYRLSDGYSQSGVCHAKTWAHARDKITLAVYQQAKEFPTCVMVQV